MSGLYVYAIGSPDQPAPVGIAGLEDAPVRAAPLPGFLLWVSDREAAPSASLERVRRHNDVVAAATTTVTPLPLRFGQWFESEAALARSLAERRAALEASLRRVEGALEMGVSVVEPGRAPPQPDRSSGRAYLEGLARRAQLRHHAEDRAREIVAELRAWLGPRVRAERVDTDATGDVLATVAYLVDRHDIGSYRDRIRAFEPRQPGLRFMTSGPWPPYGFVDAGSP